MMNISLLLVKDNTSCEGHTAYTRIVNYKYYTSQGIHIVRAHSVITTEKYTGRFSNDYKALWRVNIMHYTVGIRINLSSRKETSFVYCALNDFKLTNNTYKRKYYDYVIIYNTIYSNSYIL